MAAVECVLDCKCWLGEGPTWHAEEGALYWTDVPAKRIHRWRPATGETESWSMPEMVTTLAVRAKGGLIIASATGIDFFDPPSGRLERPGSCRSRAGPDAPPSRRLPRRGPAG